MDFPNYETWLKDVLNPADTEWWDFRTPEWYEYYKNKHRICKAFKPRSILEIGVRFGYSAHAFITASPTARYTGIDSNDPKHGGWKTPTIGWAEDMLTRTTLVYPRFIIADTQNKPEEFKSIISRHDFVHVDADHSREGCLSDLRTFWPKCSGAMLVDDYDCCGDVKYAVDKFVKENNVLKFYMPSLRGEALLIK